MYKIREQVLVQQEKTLNQNSSFYYSHNLLLYSFTSLFCLLWTLWCSSSLSLSWLAVSPTNHHTADSFHARSWGVMTFMHLSLILPKYQTPFTKYSWWINITGLSLWVTKAQERHVQKYFCLLDSIIMFVFIFNQKNKSTPNPYKWPCADGTE